MPALWRTFREWTIRYYVFIDRGDSEHFSYVRGDPCVIGNNVAKWTVFCTLCAQELLTSFKQKVLILNGAFYSTLLLLVSEIKQSKNFASYQTQEFDRERTI